MYRVFNNNNDGRNKHHLEVSSITRDVAYTKTYIRAKILCIREYFEGYGEIKDCVTVCRINSSNTLFRITNNRIHPNDERV